MSASLKLDETHYDVTLIGTSLQNTILASALSVAGKKVLHVDPSSSYGSGHTTYNFNELRTFMTSNQTTTTTTTTSTTTSTSSTDSITTWRSVVGDKDVNHNYQYIPMRSISDVDTYHAQCYFNMSEWCASETEAVASTSTSTSTSTSASTAQEASSPTSQENDTETSSDTKNETTSVSSPTPISSPLSTFIKSSRDFALDLNPTLMLSRSDIVELLVRTGVSSYLEFKAVDSTYLYMPSDSSPSLTQVPLSRSAIFQSNLLSMMEKRQLMKLMTLVVPEVTNHSKKGEEQVEEKEQDLPFIDFLRSRGLSQRCLTFVLYAIVMTDQDQSITHTLTTRVGLQRMREFCVSCGRFGPGAFLYPMYGNSELPQAYARLCCVSEGIYVLRWPHCALVYDPSTHRYTGMVTPAGQYITSNWLVVDTDHVPDEWKDENEKEEVMSRAICLVNGPVVVGSSTTSPPAVILLPPQTCNNTHVVRVVQLDEGVRATPAGTVVLYLSTPATSDSPETDLAATIAMLTTDTIETSTKPRRLWCGYYQQRYITTSTVRDPTISPSTASTSSRHPSNVLIASPPSPAIWLASEVTEAYHMFRHILPNDYFLPHRKQPINVDGESLEQLDAIPDVAGEGEGEGEGEEEQKSDQTSTDSSVDQTAATAAATPLVTSASTSTSTSTSTSSSTSTSTSTSAPSTTAASSNVNDDLAGLDALDI